MDGVFETISAAYYELTAAEKKTADYVMSHPQETQHLSISELAAKSTVAEATISRFCKKMGYKGFNAFKLALANDTVKFMGEVSHLSGEIGQDDSFSDMCRKLYAADSSAIAHTLELTDEAAYTAAVELLAGAKRVFCMGQGGSMLIASEAAHLFMTVSGKFYPVSEAHMQAIQLSNASPEDILLYYSYSGATRELIENLKLAKKRGMRSILVTRYPKSPGAEIADIVLRCGTDESPLQLGSVAAKISQLFITDILFTRFCMNSWNETLESRTRVADALADKHL